MANMLGALANFMLSKQKEKDNLLECARIFKILREVCLLI